MSDEDLVLAAAAEPRHRPWTEARDFAVGLRPIPLERWFEGGETFAEIAARKGAVMRTAPELAWRETDGSRKAQAEAAALVAAATGRSLGDGPPLLAAALAVSDDLCLMERREDGWTLTAASLCAPTFFSAPEAVGLSLRGLHAPVPGFGAELLKRVARIFDALAPDVVVERRNWTLLNSGELFLPDPAPVRARLPALAPDAAGEALHVRVERQTLRQLPATGGVLFTIRVWRWPLAALARDPETLNAFAQAWREAAPRFRDYKKLPLYDALVARWLAAHGA